MARTWVFHDGQRLTPAMLSDFNALNSHFYRRTKCLLKISSGIRTEAEHLAIWYARYVRAGDVNGRHVYDQRWWNGALWYRVSSAGTVAQPGTSNHQINLAAGRKGALDLYDTGSEPGILTRGTFRANVFDEIAGQYGYDSEGYNFGENWHKRYNRDPWRKVPSPKPKPITEPNEEDEMRYFRIGNKGKLYVYGINDAKQVTQAEASSLAKAATGTGTSKYKDGTWAFRRITTKQAKLIIDGVKFRRTRHYEAIAKAVGSALAPDFGSINADLDSILEDIDTAGDVGDVDSEDGDL